MIEKKYYRHKLQDLIIIKKIVTIHYQEIENKYDFTGETHDFFEMVYVDNNSITYKINNKAINVKEGEIFFISPNTFHSFSSKNEVNLFIMSFECKSTAMNYFKNIKHTCDNYQKSLLSRLITEARSTFSMPSFNPNMKKLITIENPLLGGEQMIKNYLEIFLIDMLRKESLKDNTDIVFYNKDDDTNIVNEIIKYLKNNIYNKVTLDDICLETNYCKTYICTHFKDIMKTSIYQYYMKLKITESKKMIKNGFSYKSIALSLQFNNPSHFTNTFKKIVKITPKKYKQSIN